MLDRLARSPTARAWLPVAVLPPMLVARRALISDDGPGRDRARRPRRLRRLPAAGAARRGWGSPRSPRCSTAGHRAVLLAARAGQHGRADPDGGAGRARRPQRDRRHNAAGSASRSCPCVVVSVLPFADDTAELFSVVLRNVALCLLALAVGDVVRSQPRGDGAAWPRSEEETRRKLGEERLRIAREVHDVVAHAMVAINVQAGVAAHRLDAGPRAGARRAARRSRRPAARRCRPARDARRAARRRRPRRRSRRRPASATSTSSRPGCAPPACDVGIDGRRRSGELPAAVHAAGYRIVQEALTNALRHARRGARAGDGAARGGRGADRGARRRRRRAGQRRRRQRQRRARDARARHRARRRARGRPGARRRLGACRRTAAGAARDLRRSSPTTRRSCARASARCSTARRTCEVVAEAADGERGGRARARAPARRRADGRADAAHGRPARDRAADRRPDALGHARDRAHHVRARRVRLRRPARGRVRLPAQGHRAGRAARRRADRRRRRGAARAPPHPAADRGLRASSPAAARPTTASSPS